MFLAANDVWHDTGRRDFWHLDGVPYFDLRAFAVVFYLMFGLLLVTLGLQLTNAKKTVKS